MSTDDLVAFLTARLDEDEAVTRRNLGKAGLGDDGNFPDYRTYDGDDIDAACDYLTQFAPPRALAEVAAKRTLVAVMATMLVPMPTPPGYPEAARKLKLEVELAEENAAKLTLRLLAQPYRSHPDWREEWRA